MAPRRKTKYTLTGTRRSRRLRKQEPSSTRASCNKAIKRHVKKCPKCCGSARATTRKVTCRCRKKPIFSEFFSYVCFRIKGKIDQPVTETMREAGRCWKRLTKDQKEDFKRKLKQGTLYCGGGSPRTNVLGTNGTCGETKPPSPGCGVREYVDNDDYDYQPTIYHLSGISFPNL